MRKKCVQCRKLTEKWEKINGSPAQCYDGCYSTTGRDCRTIDGEPAWLPFGKKKAWESSRMWKNYITA